MRHDPVNSEAYYALGAVDLFFEWDWVAAEQNLRRAVELNPKSAIAHVGYSNYLAFLGRSEEAIREAKKAVTLDPVSIMTNRNLAFGYFLARRYLDYGAQARITLNLAPTDGVARFDLAYAHGLQGMKEEALAELDAQVPRWGRIIVLSAVDERERARDLLQGAQVGCGVTSAMLHASLNQPDEAFHCLERAYKERSAMMVQLKTSPALDPLRSDPRFLALLDRMAFPPE